MCGPLSWVVQSPWGCGFARHFQEGLGCVSTALDPVMTQALTAGKILSTQTTCLSAQANRQTGSSSIFKVPHITFLASTGYVALTGMVKNLTYLLTPTPVCKGVYWPGQRS